MTTQTKREYAATLGLAIAGARGKLSKAAHAAIAKAEAEGMTFADTQYTINVKAKSEPKAPKEPKDKSKEGLSVGKDTRPSAPYRYSLDTRWRGVDSNGKTVYADGRQVCCKCGVSLWGHLCDKPSTSSIAVGIVELELVK